MTPTLDTILTGNALVIAGLADETGGHEFAAAKLGVVAMLSLFAAQEAQAGAAVRIAENAAIRTMLVDGQRDYPIAPPPRDAGLSLAELDSVNAALRTMLIGFHEAVEQRDDRVRHRAILALYQEMARGRRLVMPMM